MIGDPVWPYRAPMNFHQLQYAVAIARHGLSVTQAAAALGTSQPAISRALKALERELGQ